MTTHIRKIKGITSKLLSELQPHLKLVDQKSRSEIVNSKVASIVKYGIELYQGQTLEVKQMFCRTLNKCNRYIHGGYTLYLRTETLCRRIRATIPEEQIRNAAMIFVHKIISTKQPQQLFEQLHESSRPRMGKTLSLKQPLRTVKGNRSLLVQGLKMYNNLKLEHRLLSNQQFKRRILDIRISDPPD